MHRKVFCVTFPIRVGENSLTRSSLNSADGFEQATTLKTEITYRDRVSSGF